MKESDFKFINYKITRIEFNIEDDFSNEQKEFIQEINIENNFSNENARFVEVVLNISLKTDNDSFYFFLQIKGAFLAADNMNEDLFKKISEQNGPAILYPFARSIITNYTALANISPIILPTMNFSK